MHEFSHFLSYQASPNGNFGNQRAALDEAFGDYFATSYSRSIDSFNWKKMFSWDGNATWTGRIVQGTKKYPTDVVSTDIYATSAIISQCLNDIWTDIGRGATDSIVLQSLYLTTSNINLPAYGQLLLDADTLLTNGRYTCPISRRLVERGLLSSNRCNVGFETLNDSFSSQLFYTTNGFVIDTDLENISIEIYSIDGKKMNSFKNQKVVNTQNFAQGMYVVSIKSNNYERNLKYLKN